MLLGTILGLASGVAWSLVTTMVRPLLSHAGLGAIAATRFTFAAVILVLFGALTGDLSLVADLSSRMYVLIFASAFVSLVLGDNCYFLATRYIGVARAFPIAMTYPLWTAVIAVSFFGESGGWLFWIGALLAIGGATTLGLPTSAKPSAGLLATTGKRQVIAVALSLLAAFAWASSAIVVKTVLAEVDPMTTATLRIAIAAAISLTITVSSSRFAGAWPRGRWMLMAVALGAGTICSFTLYVFALDLIGAARASILNGTAPLFALPIAHCFLGERVTRRMLVGAVATVVGVMLVI